MKFKLILAFLAIISLTGGRCLATPPVIDPGTLIDYYIGYYDWFPVTIFVTDYIQDAENVSVYLIPQSTITSTNDTGDVLYGTDVPTDSASAISGSADLYFSEADASISCSDLSLLTSYDGYITTDLGPVNTSYSYYYSIDNESGEIYLEYHIAWDGYIKGYLPVSGYYYDDVYDYYDSGDTPIALDTGYNVTTLPGYGIPPGGD